MVYNTEDKAVLGEQKVALRMAPANPEATITIGNARFTVLDDSLIRMEYSASGEFRDQATQVVINRDWAVPDFTVRDAEGITEIRTSRLRLRYAGGPFTSASLTVTMREAAQAEHFSMWHYGADPGAMMLGRGNQGGTVRTLDVVDGAIPLEPGLISTTGFATLDDSDSLSMTEDGWVAPQEHSSIDLYFFGYGLDHIGTLKAFFKLTGSSPLLPRKVMGNWWSRYHRYTQQEYLDLMDEFEAGRLPFSVAVIDMDWHLVDIDPSLGSGWTGYTWNRELFPDPKGFLQNLHSRSMLTTLNVHPADGVRRHEEAYEEMATSLGRDPESGEEIAFDIADRKFAEAYFRYLHHPHEENGVDFWWVDWQSGSNSSIDGLDPLWMLNYLHYEDSGRAGKRPLTFSRYAGPGSHRYPVGFSGDTIVTWESLAFQPYFTATAANIGYYWWSNDIGGHMFGYKDNELQTRWVQLGTFSPILRLHSTLGVFGSKEPKNYGREAERIQGNFLRFRHLLIPYVYSAMWDAHRDAVAPVRPMYHDYEAAPEAYQNRNQYMFGPDMIVAPIVEPRKKKTGLAKTSVWLPEGQWVDLFTALRYEGGRKVGMYRTLETVPVLARAGAVIPLAEDALAPVGDHAPGFQLMAFRGPDYTGKIVEDDGSVNPEVTTINLASTWQEGALRLQLSGDFAEGAPEVRHITLVLPEHRSCGKVSVDGVDLGANCSKERARLTVDLGEVDLKEGAEIEVRGLVLDESIAPTLTYELLNSAQIDTVAKEAAWNAYEAAAAVGDERLVIPALLDVGLPEELTNALIEIVTA